MSSNERTSYPYGYKPIQPKLVSSLPEQERMRLQARKAIRTNQKAYKVLVIGESGVGKSTLVARLCEDRFLAESRQHTLGKAKAFKFSATEEVKLHFEAKRNIQVFW